MRFHTLLPIKARWTRRVGYGGEAVRGDPREDHIALFDTVRYHFEMEGDLAGLEVSYLSRENRILGGSYVDFIDYIFSVVKSTKTCRIAVGITGTSHDRQGGRRLSEKEASQVAEAYLRAWIQKGSDPFSQGRIDVPSSAVDYYLGRGSTPG